jgi:protein ImuB
MLWACLFLPSLALDVFARNAAADSAQRSRAQLPLARPAVEQPPLIIHDGARHPVVVAANAAAQNAGIRRGQQVSVALALAPDVRLHERDREAEADALAEIATLALAFTPQASLAPPAAIVAEVGASARLFGGVPRLLEHLAQQVQARGYHVRSTIAPTPTAAWLLACAGVAAPAAGATRPTAPVITTAVTTTAVTTLAQLPAALDALPLALLDLDANALATLNAVGVTTLGAARRLPRAALARRVGTVLVDVLDRAFGVASDPREPYRPPPRFERRLPLPATVETVDALGFAVNRLLHDLSGWLAARGLGAMRLTLTLVHERHLRERGLAPTSVAFAFGAPARAPAHLNAVLRERLARIELPAAVDALVLVSDETAPLAGRSLGLLSDDVHSPESASDAAAVPLVERLRSRLSDDAVVVLETCAEHRPEYAMRMIGAASIAPARAPVSDAPVPPRPLWLLDAMRPLRADIEAKPWVLRDGPERIESGWWDGRDLRRDYFVAESPHGETVWIYRDHRYGTDDGEWFMHGLFA